MYNTIVVGRQGKAGASSNQSVIRVGFAVPDVLANRLQPQLHIRQPSQSNFQLDRGCKLADCPFRIPAQPAQTRAKDRQTNQVQSEEKTTKVKASSQACK